MKTMKARFFLAVLAITILNSSCDDPASGTLHKMFGGSSSDYAYSVQQTADNGYIIAGTSYSTDISGATDSTGNKDSYIIKLDSVGNTVWHKKYVGDATGIMHTDDGGYIISAGYYVIKLDGGGKVTWQNQYEHLIDSVRQTFDGGFIAVGTVDLAHGSHQLGDHAYNYKVIKMDKNGNPAWEKILEGYDREATSIRQTDDGGYVLLGTYYTINTNNPSQYGHYDYRVARLNSDGETLWENVFGYSDADNYPTSILQSGDGGFIVSGHSGLSKLDDNGNLLWQNAQGMHINSIGETSDGGYIAAGFAYEEPGEGGKDYLIVKFDNSGNTAWLKTYGGTRSIYGCGGIFNTECGWDPGMDEATSIQQTQDGGYIVAGYSNSTDISGVTNHSDYDYYILKLDADGNL